MAIYYAITRHDGGPWELVSTGPDHEEVMREAEDIILGQEVYPEEEEIAVGPDTEMLLRNLQVVPEETAHDVYQVMATQEFEEPLESENPAGCEIIR